MQWLLYIIKTVMQFFQEERSFACLAGCKDYVTPWLIWIVLCCTPFWDLWFECFACWISSSGCRWHDASCLPSGTSLWCLTSLGGCDEFHSWLISSLTGMCNCTSTYMKRCVCRANQANGGQLFRASWPSLVPFMASCSVTSTANHTSLNFHPLTQS